MSMARNLAARLLAAATIVALAAPALAGTVVASSGPSAAQYSVGSQVTNTQRISLRDGDSVTVLENGGTRVLRGPGSFVLARRSAQADNSAFSALTARRNAGRARIASSRNPDTPITNPNLWYVDIARSGTVCVSDLANVNLWRANTAARAVVSITAPGAAAVRVTFAEREGVARWSGNAPAREGVTYTLGTAQVTFKLLSQVPAEPEALAQALIANGCTIQLEQLAAATLES